MKKYCQHIACLSAVILFIFGCESKIVAPDKNSTTLRLSINATDASPKLLTAVNQFQVIVIDPAKAETLSVTPLTLNPGGSIVGQIDSLPAETNLTFVAQALDGLFGLIFSGSTDAILTPDIVNDVLINLSPVVPLLKLTPRHFEIAGTDINEHIFDVKVFNVDSLYGISFLVRYDQSYLIATSATLDASQNPSEVIFFETDSFDSLGAFKAISVTMTDSTKAIVDTDGDGVLCNVGFVLEQQFPLADSTYIRFEPTGMTHQNRSQIPVNVLYNDDVFIRITP